MRAIKSQQDLDMMNASKWHILNETTTGKRSVYG